MLKYKEKLMNDILNLDEEQTRKFYHFFQMIKREFLSTKKNDWKNDFRNISVWKDDNFDQIEQDVKN